MHGRQDDPHDLGRFVRAQDAVFDAVRAELAAGAKRSHWMWFVFPQLRGLGMSETSWHYGLASLDEARAYLAHPVLGPRLHEACALIAPHAARGAARVLGSVDALKLRSCLTLFDAAAGGSGPFAALLDAYFAGEHDPATLRLLGSPG